MPNSPKDPIPKINCNIIEMDGNEATLEFELTDEFIALFTKTYGELTPENFRQLVETALVKRGEHFKMLEQVMGIPDELKN